MQHTLTVEDLRKLVEEGKNFSDIARTYGISPQAVQQKAKKHGVVRSNVGRRFHMLQVAGGCEGRWELVCDCGIIASKRFLKTWGLPRPAFN